MTAKDIVDLALNTGGVVALAAFAIWMLNQVWASRLEEQKRHTQQITEMWQETRRALDANTEAITRLLERLR